MMKLISLILVFSLISSQVFATECKQAASLLTEGTPAPCTGYLLDPPSAKDFAHYKLEVPLLKDELELTKKQTEKLKQENVESEAIIEKKDQQINLWQTRAVESTERLVSAENGRGTRDALFFGGGVITVLLLIWLEGQVQQARNR